jgi:hypothetical protein
MQSEFEAPLGYLDKEQLIMLLQELLQRHPVLRGEIMAMLERYSAEAQEAQDGGIGEIDDEVTEDWDYSGDEVEPDNLPMYAQAPLHAKSVEDPRLVVAEFTARLGREQTPNELRALLEDIIDEAIACSARGDTAIALDLYALLFTERFRVQAPEIIALYDDMIDAAMPTLEGLLDEASSNALYDAERASLSPLLKSTMRRKWLDYLFTLWIKRLDGLRAEDDLPEIMLDLSWNEDVPFLRGLTQEALQQRQPSSSNIIDFTHQYRTKALERFLHALPFFA